jgi:integrase
MQRGKSKVWYGVYREDQVDANGQVFREQKWVRLGKLQELPTKNAAKKKLAQHVLNLPQTVTAIPKSSTMMTFRDLVTRWKASEGPTRKTSTFNHYVNALNAYVLPEFGDSQINRISRELIQRFLAVKAKSYSKSTLRSIRVSMGLTLGWAAENGWIDKNPCTKIKLPVQTGGRTVTRSVLTEDQIDSIVAKLEEPYATLVVFLAATGLRIGEAIAVQWEDIKRKGDVYVLHVQRRIYDGETGTVKSTKSKRTIPLDRKLIDRMRKLGTEHDWIFRSEASTPVNPGNALKRYIRPVCKTQKVAVGGWHDFRHTLSTTLRRNGVHPKVVSDLLGHERVNLAMDVYDRTEVEDFVAPISLVTNLLVGKQKRQFLFIGLSKTLILISQTPH